MGGRGSLAASTSLSSISLFSWMKTSGAPGHLAKGDRTRPGGEAAQGLNVAKLEGRVYVFGGELRALRVAHELARVLDHLAEAVLHVRRERARHLVREGLDPHRLRDDLDGLRGDRLEVLHDGHRGVSHHARRGREGARGGAERGRRVRARVEL